MVVPGKNTTSPITVTLSAVPDAKTTVAIDLGLTANAPYDAATLVKKVVIVWKTQSGSESGTLELVRPEATSPAALSYVDMKPIIDDNCISCHKSATAGNKLKLDVFPFKSGKIQDAKALLAKIIERVNNLDNPMPPSDEDEPSLLPKETLDKFAAWQTGGFLAAPVVADGRYRGVLPALKVSDMLACTMTVTGDGGTVLDKEDLAPYVVAPNKPVSFDYVLQIEDPTVSVPIVVVPAAPH
jgi:hypothetical protein